MPEEFAAKAHRYDWPHELPFVPLPLTVTDEGSSDLGRVTAHHLTLALAAVVQLDGSGSRRITGRLPLDEDAIGSYTIGPSG